MALPNSGMDAVPFTPLTAEFLDDMIENIEYLGDILDGTSPTGPDGWNLLSAIDPTITYNGNHSYNVVYPGVNYTSLTSPGSRLKFTRTVTAPTGSITLNGTSQYANKTSPSGTSFTNNYVVSAFVKLTSYAQGGVVTRRDGTQGFEFRVNASGQVQLVGYNAALANYKLLSSYQSIPLNKWVHIAAQQDMSSATNSPTVNYIMIDGKDVPAVVTSGGTAPTTLVQAGNLTVGATNGAEFFPGQIAQAALYSAKVTQATILASMNQTLTGSETSIISAWKLDQASGLNDLSANANNLTAQGSPTYAADTPFTNSVTGTSVTAGTTNYGIIMAQTFSTNTTYTIQIPEGETLPTTGGIGTVSYSTQKTPYGFPPMTNVISRVLMGINSAVGDYLGMTATFTAYADVTYRFTIVTSMTQSSALTNNVLAIVDGSSTIQSQTFGALNNTNAWPVNTMVFDTKLSAGSHTVKLVSTATGGGTLVMYAAGTSNIWATYTIEQIGLV